jgi:DNA adenine methylase
MTTAEKPIITALAGWFGGKRNLAPEIIRELGDHRVYWEPFCGSMAVLMVKPPCVMETVNDLHGDLINLARVIQHEQLGPRLYRRLRRTLMHEGLFQDAAEVVRNGEVDWMAAPDLERAYAYFHTLWLGRNGVAGTSSYNAGFCVRYTANGGHAAKRWDSAIASIPAWRRRLRRVTILARDAFEVLPRIDDTEGTAIYVDPPYLVKGASYIHDFADADHQRLANALDRFTKSRVVVSYYADPRLADLYPGWTQRPIDVSKAMANQGSRGAKDVRATEVLLLNGESYADPSGRLF